MTGFLETTTARIRADLAAGRYDAGVPSARRRVPRSLRAAIERDRAAGALLVEYKRRSPGATTPLPAPRSLEEFVHRTDLDAVAGYSCLATAHGFDGAPSLVAELAGRTDRPVLFKEFVVEPAQLEVAVRTGASAVLLIARLEAAGLLGRPLAELARRARALGLEVLLELHDSAELSQVDGVAADVFGVNTRDLATLRIEREVAYATLERCRRRGLAPLLGLSGVDGPRAATEFWERGCDGLLVGSAVARAADPARFLRSLRRSGGRTGA